GGTTTINGNVTNAATKTINIRFNPAIFTGSVTNNGTIKTTNTVVTFAGPYSGNAYISDPSDNYFESTVTVVSGGSMTGGPGDRFFMTGGTFTNNGTYNVSGTLQAGATVNSGSFTQTGPLMMSGNFTNSGAAVIGGTQSWGAGTSFSNNAGSATF